MKITFYISLETKMTEADMDENALKTLKEQSIQIDRESSAQKIVVSDDFLRIKCPARIQGITDEPWKVSHQNQLIALQS